MPSFGYLFLMHTLLNKASLSIIVSKRIQLKDSYLFGSQRNFCDRYQL